jgi:adenine-specific DNA methylase
MRALLLAAATPIADVAAFWQAYASEATPLSGLRVMDPFAGGGSTLVEAARLGADVCGGDVDPLSVRIVNRELNPAKPAAVLRAGHELLDHLSSRFADLYPSSTGTPLHYFTIAEVACPACREPGLLYRNLVIARDTGKPGAVVRESKLSTFCPDCRSVHNLPTADRSRLHCCHRYHRLSEGTFAAQRYTCRQCGSRSTHRDLKTGAAPRVLLAVEETTETGRRLIRAPQEHDRRAIAEADQRLKCESPTAGPTGAVRACRKDERPRSFGMSEFVEAFTPRQLLVLGAAFDWIADQPMDADLRDSLALAVSNALATNNRLCGYATDYGRLSALFSVRGYSLPALAVELNPLHLGAGRGTLAACFNRVANAGVGSVRRHTWNTAAGRVVPQKFRFDTRSCATDVRVSSADNDAAGGADVDLCIFDPPYFDYINYDELAEFHRAWLPASELVGEPLLPPNAHPANGFGLRLGQCLRVIRRRLRSDTPIVFTYHSTNPLAWDAIGIALDEAKLSVTALWPVRSDGHMGHHSHAGNCEWDIVVVARAMERTHQAEFLQTVEAWVHHAKPLNVSKADRNNMALAISMASGRFAAVRGDNEDGG